MHAIVGFLDSAQGYVLLELFENERHLRTDREERINDLTAVNKQLIRNLAHEIEMREIAFDHMRVGVDHGMIELRADVSAGEPLEGHATSRDADLGRARRAFC